MIRLGKNLNKVLYIDTLAQTKIEIRVEDIVTDTWNEWLHYLPVLPLTKIRYD